MKKISIRKIPAIVLSIAVVVSAFIPLSGLGTVTAQENGGDYYSVTAFTKDQLKNDGWVSTVTDPSTGAVTQNDDTIFSKADFWWRCNQDGTIQGQGGYCEPVEWGGKFGTSYQYLTYTAKAYRNFSLTLNTSGAYCSSAVISIGVKTAGDVFNSDNSITIVSNPGNSRDAEDGKFKISGKPLAEGEQTLSANYNKSKQSNWMISVIDNRLTVTVNGTEYKFALNDYYTGGYISFASRNSYTVYSALSVREIESNSYYASLSDFDVLKKDGWTAAFSQDPQRDVAFADCEITDQFKSDNGLQHTGGGFDPYGKTSYGKWQDPFTYMAALTYTAKQYKYFTLSVDYELADPGSPWPIITFGQPNTTPEMFYKTTNALSNPTGGDSAIAVYPETEGSLNIAGKHVVGGRKAATAFTNRKEYHNLTITVTPGQVTAAVDGNVVEYSSQLSSEYNGGYISLMIGCSYSFFRNLSIKSLDTGSVDSFSEFEAISDGAETWTPKHTDEYFAPYGGVTDGSGNILEKNYDGSFNVKGKANINVTYFKKPESGKITTFGTSFKLAEDIKDGGIQFGSYTEDTANKEFYTLIIRGKDESTVAALTDEQKQNMVNAYLNWNTGLQDVWGSYADGTETYEIKVIKQRKYMWKDAAENNTVLQYAIRLYGDFASGNNSEVKFSAIGFSKSGDEISFANAFKTAAYGDYAKQFTVSDGVGKVDFVTLCNLGYVKTVGRAGVVEDESGKSFVTAYTNSGFEISGILTGDIWLTSDTTDKAPATSGNNYITVILDGEYKGTYWRGGAGCRDNLKLNLDGGYHTVRVERANKVGEGNMRITSIEFNGTLKRPQTNAGALNIEVLGDSISEGIGTGTSSDKAWDSAGGGDNAYYSYAAVMGRELNANLSVVAYAGKAIKEVREECYPYIGHGGVGNYNFSAANQKDVVVINLGTNGAYNVETRGNDTDDDIKNEAIALMTEVRKNNPNAYIIWVYGMMAPNQEHFAAYEAAVSAMNDGKIIAYKIGEKNSFTGHGYDNYHPSKDEHAAYGKELAEYIKTLNIK
mgnify:FL=1